MDIKRKAIGIVGTVVLALGLTVGSGLAQGVPIEVGSGELPSCSPMSVNVQKLDGPAITLPQSGGSITGLEFAVYAYTGCDFNGSWTIDAEIDDFELTTPSYLTHSFPGTTFSFSGAAVGYPYHSPEPWMSILSNPEQFAPVTAAFPIEFSGSPASATLVSSYPEGSPGFFQHHLLGELNDVPQLVPGATYQTTLTMEIGGED